MNLLPLLATGTGSGSYWIYLILLVPIAMMFFTSSKQKKQAKERQAQLDSLKSGDEIVTIGGFFATVVSYNEEKHVYTVKLEPDGVKAVIKREAVAYQVTDAESAK